MKNKKFRIALAVSLISIAFYLALSNIGSLYAALKSFTAVLAPVTTGAVLAYIMNLPQRFFENKVFGRSKLKRSVKRGLSILLAYVSVLVVCVFAVLIVIPQFVTSISLLVSKFPDYQIKLQDYLTGLRETSGITGQLVTSIFKFFEDAVSSFSNYITVVAEKVVNFTIGMASGVINFILAVIFSIYVLGAKDKLGSIFDRVSSALFSDRVNGNIKAVLKLLNEKFSSFITGQTFEAVLLGTLCCVGMLIIGLPYPFLIGVIIGITALIPILGAWVGTILSGLLILFESPIKALIFVIFILTLQQIDNNLIYPKVIGNAVGLDGLWIIFTVTVGGAIGGIMGVLVAVPVMSVIYVLASKAVSKKLKEKNAAEPAGKTDKN